MLKPTLYRPSLSIALAAVIGACQSPTDARVEVAPQVSLSVGEGSAVPNGTPILPLIPQLLVSAGEIDVLGHFRTSTPCWSLSSRVEQKDRTITLTITALESSAGGCTQVITVRPYDARIAPLASGRYTVSVVHAWASGSQKPEEVLRQEVVVP